MAVKQEPSCRRFLLRYADPGGPLRAAGSAQQQRCKTAPRHPFAWPRARYVNINHCQPGSYVAELGAKAFGPELRSDEASRATRLFQRAGAATREPSFSSKTNGAPWGAGRRFLLPGCFGNGLVKWLYGCEAGTLVPTVPASSRGSWWSATGRRQCSAAAVQNCAPTPICLAPSSVREHKQLSTRLLRR